jgi:hypothetical protein
MYFNEWKINKNFTEQSSISASKKLLLEYANTSRYSVEVNYRTKKTEILEGFAKICLGYVSAFIKQHNYHVKQVYENKPLRLIISSRNWDDGEWTSMIYFHPEYDGGSFIICKGFYNRENKTISIQSKTKCKGDSAAEIASELLDLMETLKNKTNKHTQHLKGIPLKRGPKK